MPVKFVKPQKHRDNQQSKMFLGFNKGKNRMCYMLSLQANNM